MNSKTPSFADGMQAYSGSCHCGAVRFEADIDLSQGTIRCNCSFCIKTAWWGVVVEPDGFRLTPDRNPESEGGKRVRCSHCGVLVCVYWDAPEQGGAHVSINVRTLDGVALDGVSITYLDGASDTWSFIGTTIWQNPFTTVVVKEGEHD